MDTAAAMEAPDGVCLAPPFHRVGPLLGNVVKGQALQRAYKLAVDDAGRQRIELPGHCRHAGLVELRQTLLDLSCQDEQSRVRYPTDGTGGRVTFRADRDGAPSPLPSAVGVSGQHSLVGADDGQPRVGRRLAPAFEESVGACEPPPHGRHERGVKQQMHREPDGSSAGGEVVVGIDTRRVRSLPRLDRHVEVPGGVGHLGQERKIGRLHKAGRVRSREEIEGALPLAPRCRCPRLLYGGLNAGIAH